MGEHDEQIVFEMGYNKGFKDGIKGSIPKDQYEARLRADMVAMLEDLRLAIEELDYPKDCDYACNGCLYWGDVDKLIDEKINALRGENETC